MMLDVNELQHQLYIVDETTRIFDGALMLCLSWKRPLWDPSRNHQNYASPKKNCLVQKENKAS